MVDDEGDRQLDQGEAGVVGDPGELLDRLELALVLGQLADALDVDPIPLVVIEILVSNIGGTATLIGDPPNIMIAGATGLSFVEFIVNLAPVAIVTFVVVTVGVYWAYRSLLQISPEAQSKMMELNAWVRQGVEFAGGLPPPR